MSECVGRTPLESFGMKNLDEETSFVFEFYKKFFHNKISVLFLKNSGVFQD